MIVMKTLRFCVLALGVSGLAASAFAASLAPTDWNATVAERAEPTNKAQRRSDMTAQLPCRDVEVDHDEGYGVSSRETRSVCDVAR
jgi:hypothetical protein